jgi:hypothetical protein
MDGNPYADKPRQPPVIMGGTCFFQSAYRQKLAILQWKLLRKRNRYGYLSFLFIAN